MNFECRIFKRAKNGKMELVETVANEEILKNTNYKCSFNVHPRRKQKIQPREKRKPTKSSTSMISVQGKNHSPASKV